MLFADLRLADPILRAISYKTATPIQAKAIPFVLEGKDVLGSAQTGTGKTAAFAMPILHRLFNSARPAGKPRARALVLCPTRELASQIAQSFCEYGRHVNISVTTVFGGVGERPQINALRRGVDVIVATPGRLLDLVRQNHADLKGIQTLVLDEADRMLDMGFIHDIRKLVAQIPAQRQTLFFSATMPREIRQLADSLLKQPAVVEVERVSTPVQAVEQSVYFVSKQNKPELLARLVKDLPMFRAIVFTRTKHGADRVVRHLDRYGIRSQAIHGNKSQNMRERALSDFKNNKTHVLVATDIASRGIDVDGITHVVNYDLTHEPETYVHRIGRTARAGATGAAVAFCDSEEVSNLRAIERLIRQSIPVKTHGMKPGDFKPLVIAEDRPERSGHGGGRQQGGHREGGRREGRQHQQGGGRHDGAERRIATKPVQAKQGLAAGRGAGQGRPTSPPMAPAPKPRALHPLHGKNPNRHVGAGNRGFAAKRGRGR
jgi:ATP-dependent RNA helicase RhlE